MNSQQRELISKYMSDLSKGLLLVVVAGAGAGKLDWLYAVFCTVLSLFFVAIAFVLENTPRDTSTP